MCEAWGRGIERGEQRELFLLSMRQGHGICCLKGDLLLSEVVKVRVGVSLRRARSLRVRIWGPGGWGGGDTCH